MENPPREQTDVRLYPRVTLDEWVQLRYFIEFRELWQRGIVDVKPLC